jgi:hypothetical protein
VFLIEAQNRFVKDELALSRITVVVAIIHLEALIRCGDLLGSVDIRVDHLALALEVKAWLSSGHRDICSSSCWQLQGERNAMCFRGDL